MKKRRKKAKVYYDNEIDALYLKLGDEPPEGVNLDTTSGKRTCRQEFPVSKDRFDTSLLLTEWGGNIIQNINLELMNSRKKGNVFLDAHFWHSSGLFGSGQLIW